MKRSPDGRPVYSRMSILIGQKLLLAYLGCWVADLAFARNDRCQFLVCDFILARPLRTARIAST